MEAILIGFLSAIVVLIIQARIGLRKFMGYPAAMDAAVTVLLMLFLHGTFSGMVAAMAGGLFYSAMITVIRYYWGYSRLGVNGWQTKEGVIFTSYLPRVHYKLQQFKRQQCTNLKLSTLLSVCTGLFLIWLFVL